MGDPPDPKPTLGPRGESKCPPPCPRWSTAAGFLGRDRSCHGRMKASHLHSLALQGADPAQEGLSMFRRGDAQAHQVPATRSWSDLAGPALSLAPPTEALISPSPSLDRAGLPIEAGARLLGSLSPSLGPGSSDSLDSHLGHDLQGPIASCSEAVLVAAQVQGLQPGTHGAKGGEGGEGTVRQGCGRPREQRSCSQPTARIQCPAWSLL